MEAEFVLETRGLTKEFRGFPPWIPSI